MPDGTKFKYLTRLPGIEPPAVTAQPRPSEGPLVTVVLGTYNRPKLLKIAIQSVLDQTYRNIELMVVNDGGEDVGGIVQSFGDTRINYISIPTNMGAAHSYNLRHLRIQWPVHHLSCG